MREGWKSVKLVEACELFNDGDWIESKNQSPKGIRLIQTGNIGEGFFKNREDKARYVSEDTFLQLKCTEVLPGDLLVSRLPEPVGRSCLIPDIDSKMITGVDCTIIRTKDDLLPEFLKYFQLSRDYLSDVDSRTSGTTRKRISRKNLGLIQIPLPPLPEQKQIVAILDTAFAAIDQAKANIEKNIENAKELFQSKLNEVFEEGGEGWEEKSLGDDKLLKIIDGDRGKNYPKKVDFLQEGHCVFMNTGNVRPNGFDFSNVVFITEERDNLLRKGKLQRQDVVMTTRGTIGNLGWYSPDIEYEHIRINSGMLVFRVNQEKILPEYLFALFRSSIITNQIEEKTSGAAQPQLPIKTLVTFKFPVHSSLKEQKEMVRLIEKMEGHQERLMASYYERILNLEELKKSLLQQAFSGELTLRQGSGQAKKKAIA
ncbi:MAG: hypothetical protein HKN39_06790 [Flavobacteriales bacterium]|nr:hypothetical protein [Flavobacteriales bacterium]